MSHVALASDAFSGTSYLSETVVTVLKIDPSKPFHLVKQLELPFRRVLPLLLAFLSPAPSSRNESSIRIHCEGITKTYSITSFYSSVSHE
eukprot:scaffold769_cov156-Chaetoceros_neogracile.AAC.1